MLKINGVTKRFGSLEALSELNLTIEKGSVFGLVGSNGSGKSTLLRIISGVLAADGGEVTIDDIPAFENCEIKGKCFFISDYPFYYNDSTLDKMASLYRKIYPSWSEEEYLRLCSVFPIGRRDKIISMSKGMQRQAALILALSTMPEYLMLDEIFDGLDPVVRQLLKRLLMDSVSQRQMTVIIASHNLRELEDICDHVGFLHHGGILLERELDELKLGIHRIQFALSAVPQGDIFKGLEIVKTERRGSLFSIVARGDADAIMARLNALNPLFIEALPLTLEEVFISEMEAAGYDINNILA